jgi:type I restriction enzyme S subunit
MCIRMLARLDGRYGHLLLHAYDLKKVFYGFGSGLRQNLSWEDFKYLPCVLPPLPEQAAIVRYLDHVDRRVRRLTRAKRKLIALLTEQKQAIIHRAVTRGLDPDVPLKDSGVEWLGKVPEHWEVRRNGRLFAQRNETGFADLPILEVSLRTGIRIRDFETSARKQLMSDRDKYKRARTWDIAYNTMRMWQGAVGIAPTDGLVSPAYVIARPLPGTVSRYFEMLFRTSVYMQEVDNYSRGIVKDRNRLYWEDFKAMPSCYPPPSEQSAIVDHLDQATADIDTTITRAEREIELLNEYRTRLIADVVTGKLDVRDAAAALPEVDPLAEDEDADDLDADLAQDAAELDETLEEAEA